MTGTSISTITRRLFNRKHVYNLTMVKSKRKFLITPILLLILIILSLLVFWALAHIKSERSVSVTENKVQTVDTEKSEMKPFKNGEILITPLVILDFDTNRLARIEFKTVEGWEFGENGFEYSSYYKENVSYYVEIIKTTNPNIKLQFDFAETEVNTCDFDKNQNEVFRVFIPEYKSTETSFGTLRLGEAMWGENNKNKYFAVCQRWSDFRGDNPNQDWGGFTKIGFIQLHGISNPDGKTLSEITEILKKIEIREYTLVK